MRGMRAENERGLEKQLVDQTRAAAVARRIEALLPVRVLVRQPEAQELRREEAHVWLHGPLPARRIRILRRIVARAERPAPPRLQLRPRVPAEALTPLLLEEIDDAILVRVDLAVAAADRVDSLGPQRQQGMQPAVGTELVLQVVADEPAAEAFARLAAGDRGPHLQRLRVTQLE